VLGGCSGEGLFDEGRRPGEGLSGEDRRPGEGLSGETGCSAAAVVPGSAIGFKKISGWNQNSAPEFFLFFLTAPQLIGSNGFTLNIICIIYYFFILLLIAPLIFDCFFNIKLNFVK